MTEASEKNRIAHGLACALMLAFAVSSAHAAEPSADPWGALQQGLRPNLLPAGAPLPQWSLEARMRHHHVPGVAIALVRDGRVVDARGYGFTFTVLAVAPLAAAALALAIPETRGRELEELNR